MRVEQEQETARPVALIALLLVVALALALVVWRMQPPAPKSADAPSDQFSAGRARAVLEELLADGAPHPAGSPANDRVRERIIARLEALGYQVDVQDATACWQQSGVAVVCSRVRNILTRLPGQTDSPAVMIVSHYDSAAAGPGAADAGASVAAILEIARILKQQGPLRNPIILMLTDGEEDGSMGAHAFVKEHPWAKDVGAVVNLEGRGTSGQSLMFETSADNAWLVEAYASAAPHPATNSLLVESYRAAPSVTDLTVLTEAGVPGLNLAFMADSSRYHTPLDNLDNLDPGSLQHQGETALAVARALAMRDPSYGRNPPTGDAAYTDLLGLVILRWPAGWTTPLAILAAALLLVAAFGLVRRGRMTIQAPLWGVLAAFLTLVLAIVLGLALTLLIRLLTSAYAPWRAYPLPTRLALWASALLSAGVVGAKLVRRAGWWGLGVGVWLWWVVLALLLDSAMPGAAILFLFPALCAALLIAAGVWSPWPWARSALAREAALIVPAFLAGIISLQAALHFESVAGLGSTPGLALMVGLVASTVLPFMALPLGRTTGRTWLIGVTAAVMVIATIAAVLVPTSSQTRPEPLNLYRYEDRDTGAAYRVALPWGETLPKSLGDQFNLQLTAVFPWTSSQSLAASAQPLSAAAVPAPDLEIVSDEQSDGGRLVKVRLHSAREPREFDIGIPLAALASISVGGETFPVDPADASGDYGGFFCFGPSCDGLEVTLQLKTVDPVEVFVVDRSGGLPPEDESFGQARPATAAPVYDGDQTMILHRVKL